MTLIVCNIVPGAVSGVQKAAEKAGPRCDVVGVGITNYVPGFAGDGTADFVYAHGGLPCVI